MTGSEGIINHADGKLSDTVNPDRGNCPLVFQLSAEQLRDDGGSGISLGPLISVRYIKHIFSPSL